SIAIETDFPETPLFCKINKEKFQNAFDNLCFNSIKFTNAGGTITIKAQEANDMINIHVIDTGIGIEPDMISRLFEKYTKAGRVGTAGEASTGLGLYIVKQIIDMHNGAIEVLSEVGKGSEFIIKLPKSEAELSE
ncbi:MAG: ATP-binding protein, partial [Candidatus Cloacimonetes bacterium]|nr:ATP-binding protein [Candidatus Cloacimonadota bacterium]